MDTFGSPSADDRGQLVPLFGVVVVIAFAVALGAVRVGVAANDRARAQGAADATALAAAGSGDAEAAKVAAANDAEVLSIERAGIDVTVEVRVGPAQARASAQLAAPEATGTVGLHPDLAAAIARAEARLGRRLHITSGLRSRAAQEELWRNRHRNPYPVARPGTSAHERGLAIDVSTRDLGDLVPVAREVGLCRPLPTTDPIHFRLCSDL